MPQTSAYFYNEITLLKAAAALFITWFHFKWSVPHSLSPLFIGGAIGNSIFFFCSGYLLSFKSKDNKYPGQWFLKKYFRIIPAVWVTLALLIVCTFIRTGAINGYHIMEWFYPKQFWFIRAIFIYYFVTYIAYTVYSHFHSDIRNSKINKEWLLAMIFFTTIIHVIYYLCNVRKDCIVMDDNGVYCWFYWYAFFLLGYYNKNYGGVVKYNKYSLLECIFAIVLFFIYKRLAPSYGFFIYLQFVLIPSLLLYIVISFRRGGYYLISLKQMSLEIKNYLEQN